MKKTVHLPRALAERLKPEHVEAADMRYKACLISINEPDHDVAQLQDGWTDVLRISFWDITKRIPDLRNKDTWLEPLNEEEAKTIADFIKEHKDNHIVVHCRAGISRSAAVVRLLVDLGWDFDFSLSHHDMSGYNIHVYSMLKKHFPELLPIGA